MQPMQAGPATLRGRRRFARPWGGATIAVAVLAGCAVAVPAQAIAEPPAKIDRVLKDPRITESSGLARSNLKVGRLWTHNDSGDTARVFAIGPSGATVRVFSLTGASHLDWEAMASVVSDGVSYLYLGDIGDNGKKRPYISIFRIREPKPGAKSGARTPVTWRFAYPDGAHNAEAMLVRPGSLRIYVVSKVNGGNGAIYRAPKQLSRTKVNMLTKVRSAPEGVSDATFLGKHRFALRVYQTGYLYSSVHATPLAFRFPDKGEGLARGFDKKHVYISNEGKFTPIWKVQLPS